MTFQIQVRGEFGGSFHHSWSPAITGTENQTGESDDVASTFESHDEAETHCDYLTQTYCGDRFDDASGRAAGAPRAVEFRVVEL